MKIQQLPSGSYRVEKMYKGKRYSVTFPYKPTQKEVMQALTEKMNNTDISTAHRTFNDYALDYFRLKENVLSKTTIRGYNTVLNSISDNFKKLKLSDITQVDIQKEINNYSSDHKPKSVYNMNGFISTVIHTYRPNFNYSITLPQKVENVDYIPTDAEVKAILNEAKGRPYEIPLWLAMAGMRRSEICAITKNDLTETNMLSITKAYVEDKDGNWHVQQFTKNETSRRTIQLIPYVADLIRNAPTEPNERVYQSYPNNIYYGLHRYCDKLGITHFRLHTCRAYYVSMCHAIGIPDQYILANTGHKNDRILKQVYRRTKSDTQLEMDNKVLDKMNTFFNA